MKHFLFFLCGLLLSVQSGFAGDNKKHEINWMSFEQAEVKMKEHPKKVIVDVYTGWCGWCKKLDRDIYTNDSLIDYVNEHFYAVKFDAEQKTTIHRSS